MTLFCFIRHGHHDLLGRKLVGRAPTVRLSGRGREQAAQLAEGLAALSLAAVISSPSERALETAAPIAARQALRLSTDPELDEVDFGEWTGRSFAELDGDPGWRSFNAMRGRAAIPGGERMLEVQARVVTLIESLVTGQHSNDRPVALVSHGDVIRAALLHYLGMPLDFIHRIEIAPASVSLLEATGASSRVIALGLSPNTVFAGTVL